MERKIILLIGGVLLFLMLWFGWGAERKTEVNDGDKVAVHDHAQENFIHLTPQQIKDFDIQIKEASSGELDLQLSARGKIVLHPDRLAHVLPKISGVVKEAKKNIGDTVKQGEPLAVFESREIADMKATYLAALEKMRLSQSLFERESRLYDKKISPEQDYLNAKSSYEDSKIQLQLAKQKLQALGINDEALPDFAQENDPSLRLYTVYAPIDGTILQRHITTGEFVESTAVIYEVADVSKVWVEIGIYPKDAYKVKEGQHVEITIPIENLTADAKIIYLSPIIQEETITAKAIAELQNDENKWRPGTFVTVNIGTKKVPADIVVPKEAIQNINGQDVLFIKTHDGFESREIQKGTSDKNNVEVLSGIKSGEKYAASHTFLLKAELGKAEAEHEH
ncbi:cobalt-zinc-cadmium resistance protein CzcB [Parachlamydia acanthamoebae UV-7]|jgi:cobalt-zinc-cadmium efflux system membrane fusion protein|uniref:Cobalt-zinc-cadmium resistance protein CzcB n=2 Tax=Parachlamydia acanthamoebae TaxID=83552 RepID=F8L2F5_PARAV|nr:efflux RND transporter periplasmic adaptor subunit [Parachlamydia acanthamoebae]EFB40155.1 hypothetical protein pah_c253o006 [Parachlamydia acanthamoebae str. Hall's coccus]CCB87468.1 cobalt-zinc-cadmium resistance protein CzcB [Parachlamydia acanthamoebae UV-7]